MPGAGSRVLTRIQSLPPAYFALPMATGIVSIACHDLGLWFFAQPLLWLNLTAYVVLWVLFAIRAAVFPHDFWTDMNSHTRGPGFFTMIAGTNIVGSQFAVIRGDLFWASVLLILGTCLWAFWIYAILTLLIVRGGNVPLAEGINGGWLVATVGTQSVAVLSAVLAARSPGGAGLLSFYALCMFFAGGFLYLLVIALIFYRLVFFELRPEAMRPPYWINMGAEAISTLAGASIILSTPGNAFLELLRPFTVGLTVLFWTTATWWIPYLVIFGVWRHGIRRVPFTYSPDYWSMVFPLGMYTACTLQLAAAAGLDFLRPLADYFIYAALAAWFLTFAGLVRSLARIPFGRDT